MTPTQRQRLTTAAHAWGQISYLHLKKGKLARNPKAAFDKTPTDCLLALANSLLIQILWDKINTFHRWNGTSGEKVCSETVSSSCNRPGSVFWLNSSGSRWLIRPNCLSLSVSKLQKKLFLCLLSIGEYSFLVLLWIFLGSPKDKSLIDFSLLFFHVFPPSLNYSRG